MGGVSDLITRLERDSASISCRTAKTTSPVLKVITRGSEPPADGSMNLMMIMIEILHYIVRKTYLRERRVMTRMIQTELLSLSLAVSAGWVQKVANSREAAQRSGRTATFLSRIDLLSSMRLTSMSI